MGLSWWALIVIVGWWGAPCRRWDGVVGACHCSCWGLVVVYVLWMVVVVYGGCRVRRGRGLVVVHALWLVVICERLWWWL